MKSIKEITVYQSPKVLTFSIALEQPVLTESYLQGGTIGSDDDD